MNIEELKAALTEEQRVDLDNLLGELRRREWEARDLVGFWKVQASAANAKLKAIREIVEGD